MTRLLQIEAQIAALKAEKRKLFPRVSMSPGQNRLRSFRPEGKGQRDPREHDAAYLAWLHVDTDCVACLIEGRPANRGPIEAAHQKLAIAAKGWREGGLGPRIHDARCCPLCACHHRLAPNSCDTGGQRKFWDRLGLGDDIADFCAALHQAFRSDAPAMPVIRAFAASKTVDGGPTAKSLRSSSLLGEGS